MSILCFNCTIQSEVKRLCMTFFIYAKYFYLQILHRDLVCSILQKPVKSLSLTIYLFSGPTKTPRTSLPGWQPWLTFLVIFWLDCSSYPFITWFQLTRMQAEKEIDLFYDINRNLVHGPKSSPRSNRIQVSSSRFRASQKPWFILKCASPNVANTSCTYQEARFKQELKSNLK